jgi:hypothetical protein
MKRWLLAVAALLYGAVGMSFGDYIVIKYNLSAERENEPQQGQPGFPGVGGPGAGGSGAGGPGPGLAPPGAGGSGAGGPTTRPGMAGPGAGGSGAGFGGPGAGMMQPGIMGGIGGAAAGEGGEPEDIEISPLYAIAVVELKIAPDYRYMTDKAQDAGYACKITHKWGITMLKKSPAVEFAPLRTQGGKYVPTIAKEFENKLRIFHQEKEKPAADSYADLAEWALSHGLLADFHKVMEEFAQAHADSPVVKAYQKMKADLERPAASNREAATWRSKLGMDQYKIAEPDNGHYTLLHNSGSSTSREVQGRLTRMENAFAGFYYWMALRLQADAGRVKVPQERLLAIVVPQPRDFDRAHDLFDNEALVADGFCARRDNLVVYSGVRRDQAYEDLRNYADSALRGMDTSQLLNGKGDNNLQTMVLVQKALEEDGELATVSHEVPRQLLAASGLLPRHVEVPRWVEFGMGSFFGTAKGSPWQTLAAPSGSLIEANNYLYTYKVWRKAKKLDDPKTALEKVVTDQYFRLSKGDKDPVALEKARTLTWALNYFLAQRKLKELLDYYGELARMPRDLEFDDQALLRCFARAFGLVDPKDPAKIDQFKLGALAREWDDYIARKPVEFEEMIKEIHKDTTKKMNPGVAGAPGGGRGAGPGAGPGVVPPAGGARD